MATESSASRIKAALARIERKHGKQFDFDKMMGGYRLTNASGNRDISPRLKAGDFALWLEAFEEGLDFTGPQVVRTPNSFTGGYSDHCGACGMLLKTYCPSSEEKAAQAEEQRTK